MGYVNVGGLLGALDATTQNVNQAYFDTTFVAKMATFRDEWFSVLDESSELERPIYNWIVAMQRNIDLTDPAAPVLQDVASQTAVIRETITKALFTTGLSAATTQALIDAYNTTFS